MSISMLVMMSSSGMLGLLFSMDICIGWSSSVASVVASESLSLSLLLMSWTDCWYEPVRELLSSSSMSVSWSSLSVSSPPPCSRGMMWIVSLLLML